MREVKVFTQYVWYKNKSYKVFFDLEKANNIKGVQFLIYYIDFAGKILSISQTNKFAQNKEFVDILYANTKAYVKDFVNKNEVSKNEK